jgi:hypothetical protein
MGHDHLAVGDRQGTHPAASECRSAPTSQPGPVGAPASTPTVATGRTAPPAVLLIAPRSGSAQVWLRSGELSSKFDHGQAPVLADHHSEALPIGGSGTHERGQDLRPAGLLAGPFGQLVEQIQPLIDDVWPVHKRLPLV